MKKGALVVLIFGTVLAVTAYTFSRRQYFSSKDPLLDQVRENFGKLDPKYKEIPLRVGDSAYTENKEVITLCLIDPETNLPYDINTIMYVALHELAHVTSNEVGHGNIFKTNFSNLLKKAASVGIYNPRKPIPMSYCHVKTGSH